MRQIKLVGGMIAIMLLLFVSAESTLAASVTDSPHNMSASGPGDIKASVESRVCVFCHTPHFAEPAEPLWSHAVNEGQVYNLYESTTLNASPSQPDGPSRLCLSCHDGTIALGQIGSGLIPFDAGVTVMPDRSTNLATDLDDDHPIGIRFDSTLASNDGQLNPPASLPPAIKLRDEILHCTSCHDPHDNRYGMFLTMDNTDSALCTMCHAPTDWLSSGHRTNNIYCQDCHLPHNAKDQPKRLLKGGVEEDTCLAQCHNGVGPGINVQNSFSQSSIHPVDAVSGVHDPTENSLVADYHVECVDCHNPHQSNGDDAAIESGVTGHTKGVKGINLSGNTVDPARYEYEVCFKCHADNSFVSLVSVPREIEEINKRISFNTSNPSYHPVTGVGKSFDVPSLRPEYLAGSSRITCSDCHNTSDGTRAGGFGANGVHGSSYPAMLAKSYFFETAATAGPSWDRPYVESEYELCWTCHDPGLLMAVGDFHDRHVNGQQTPCYLCHDPHGVFGMEPANRRLINFTTLFGISAAFDGGGCTSSCHSGGVYRALN